MNPILSSGTAIPAATRDRGREFAGDFLNGISAGLSQAADPGSRAFGAGVAGGMAFANDRRAKSIDLEFDNKAIADAIARFPVELKMKVEEARALGEVDADLRISLERFLGDQRAARAIEHAITLGQIENEQRLDLQRGLNAMARDEVRQEDADARDGMGEFTRRANEQLDARGKSQRSASSDGIRSGITQQATAGGTLARKFVSFAATAANPMLGIARAVGKAKK